MEPGLDSGFLFIPKTISDFLAKVSAIKDNFDKLSKLDDYVQKLEDEMRKIEAFKRELPLSMLLLDDAIRKLKEEATLFKEFKDGSFTEELIPLKSNLDEEDGKVNLGDDLSDKRSWLSSVQLWNTNIDCDFRKRDSISEHRLRNEEGDRSVPENPIALCNCRNRGETFVSCKGQSGFGLLRKNMKEDNEVSEVPNLSLKPPIAESKRSSFLMDQVKLPSKPQHLLQEHQSLRKQRRCWSPELHRRFIGALQQLGGSQAATPKQIREIMQVDGLTNDEVKSHLQKYRFHVRKLTPLSQNQSGDYSKTSHSQSNSPQGPLLVCRSGKSLSSIEGDSMAIEEDEKSDGYSWKGGFNRSREDV